MSTFIVTGQGHKVNFLDLTPEVIDPLDVAWSLAGKGRFNDHLSRRYTVAEHSMYCAAHTKGNPLEALLHDATEAYCNDVPAPLKRLCPSYAKIEQEVWEKAIAPRFGLSPQLSAETKHMDLIALYVERRDLIPEPHHAKWPPFMPEGLDDYPSQSISGKDQFAIAEEFLRTLKYLTEGQEDHLARFHQWWSNR